MSSKIAHLKKRTPPPIDGDIVDIDVPVTTLSCTESRSASVSWCSSCHLCHSSPWSRSRGSAEARIVFYQVTSTAVLVAMFCAFVGGLGVARVADYVVTGIATVLVFGRLGCYRVACCHGRHARWGVRYDERHVAYGLAARFAGRTLLPVQLFESAASAALAVHCFAALPMTFDAGTEKERHVQRVSKLEGQQHLVLDLLIAEAAFEGLLARRIEIALPEGPLAVVPRDVLLHMKRLAGGLKTTPTSRSSRHPMSREPKAAAVVARLEELRRSYAPERDEDARVRLARDAARGRPALPFEREVALRLAELRALLELTTHLQGRVREGGASSTSPAA